jgi:hypothetical protein
LEVFNAPANWFNIPVIKEKEHLSNDLSSPEGVKPFPQKLIFQ